MPTVHDNAQDTVLLRGGVDIARSQEASVDGGVTRWVTGTRWLCPRPRPQTGGPGGCSRRPQARSPPAFGHVGAWKGGRWQAGASAIHSAWLLTRLPGRGSRKAARGSRSALPGERRHDLAGAVRPTRAFGRRRAGDKAWRSREERAAEVARAARRLRVPASFCFRVHTSD